MLISNAYPSQYLKASDLQGRTVKVVIDDCQLEDLDGEHKPILRFRGRDKGMVLNRTNAATIAESYGDETDKWRGKEVEIFTAKVNFQGRLVDGLRVRALLTTPPPSNGFDDDIPF